MDASASAMIVAAAPHQHLTYCTNIHPGESWDQVFANVAEHVVAVKARVCPDRPFGVGLRLSAAAAARLAAPAVLESFKGFLDAQGLYVFTINGFPYGAFHGTEVKERVYRPDWLEEDRIAYTDGLARLLAALLPAGVLEGSVSTVPGAFKARAPGPAEAGQIASALRRHARALWQIRETTGRTIALALEPEPHCLLETTGDAVGFFGDHLFSRASIAAFVDQTGLAPADAEQALVRHLGVCLDACHAAVEFEDPGEALQRLAGAGIRVAKIQISAGLRVTRPDRASLAALAAFADPVYLHQVVVRRGQILSRHLDLPQALADETAQPPGEDDCEWRVHFHVPLFQERLGPFHNTQPFLDQLLPAATRAGLCSHFEVETYTWDVLPEEHRQIPVVDAIARELAFALERLHP